MNVIITTSECKPFCKTGGLGDIAFSLSYELVKQGHICDVIMPYYQVIQNQNYPVYEVSHFNIYTNYQDVDTIIYAYKENGVTYYFVKQDRFFNRDRLYGYNDDTLRYASFNLAVIEFLKRTNNFYEIMQCNDWQMGMLPLLTKINGLRIKTLLTIHNPAFQGYASPSVLPDFFRIDRSYFDYGLVRFNDQVAYLKAGIMCADKINTVSVTHAKELLGDFNCFNGLGYIIHLRENDFSGITNGLDYSEFDPKTDDVIPMKFDTKNYKEGKLAALKVLANELSFTFDENKKPLIYGVVSRLTSQKGIHKVVDLIPLISITGGKLIILGSGEDYLEGRIHYMQRIYPDTVYFWRGYSDYIAHLIYAASDFYLMPSQFEPCGISQLISMRYGSLPIASNVGGLNDTIHSYGRDGYPTGFLFDNRNNDDTARVFINAYNITKDRIQHKKMILNAMNYDSSWKNTIQEYIKLFNIMLK